MTQTAYASVLETITCPLCGGQDSGVLIPADYPPRLGEEELLEFYRASSDHKLIGRVVRCADCSLAYINPRPRPEIILAGYSQAEDPTFVRQNEQRVRTFGRNLCGLVRKLGLTPSRQARVLDVGCAGGAFPKAAHDLGFSVVGVEPSSWLAAQGRALYGLDIRAGLLADQELEPASFDLITLWDVVEHLPDPADVLTHIHGLLKPSGALILNYPDYRSLVARLLGRSWPFWLDVHLLYFTRKTLADLVGRCGFDVVGFSPFWQTLQLGYVMKRASAYFSGFGLLGRAVEKVGLAGVPFTYNMGQTTLIARKR